MAHRTQNAAPEAPWRDEKTLESALRGAGDGRNLDAQATGTDAIREPEPGRRRRGHVAEDESASQASRSTQRRRDDL